MKIFLRKLFSPINILIILILSIVLFVFSMGYADEIITILSSEKLTFKFGKIEVSAYLILKAIFAFILLFWVAGTINSAIRLQVSKMKKFDVASRELILKVVQVVIYAVVFLFSLDILGIDLTALTVFSGAIGIGLGFGLQKITSNFISGIILLLEKSIKSGDLIETSSGLMGFVRRSYARYTIIEAFDGREVIIPNEDLITNQVINWTFSDYKARIDIKIGVSYDSDIVLAQKIMLEVAKNHPKCSKKNDPSCFLDEFASSSVNFHLMLWIDDVTDGRLEPKSEILFQIWHKFKENNISIPFPQMDVHLRKLS